MRLSYKLLILIFVFLIVQNIDSVQENYQKVSGYICKYKMGHKKFFISLKAFLKLAKEKFTMSSWQIIVSQLSLWDELLTSITVLYLIYR